MNKLPIEMKQAALWYAEQGLAVFPVYEALEIGRCACVDRERCKRPGKHPRVKAGVKAATRDVEVIDRWWTQWPRANIGVNVGRSDEGGLLVIDIDPKNKGSILALPLAEEDKCTPTILTGGGGLHLIFSAEGKDFSASNVLIEAPGIDVRAGDSYSIFPDSKHVSGRRYQWSDGKAWGEVPVRSIPEDLLKLLKPRDFTPEPVQTAAPPKELLSTGGLHPYVAAALRREFDKLQQAPIGTRNFTLCASGFSLFQLSQAGLLPEAEVEALLTNAALALGLEANEIARTIASAKDGARRKPRKVWPDNLYVWPREGKKRV